MPCHWCFIKLHIAFVYLIIKLTDIAINFIIHMNEFSAIALIHI